MPKNGIGTQRGKKNGIYLTGSIYVWATYLDWLQAAEEKGSSRHN